MFYFDRMYGELKFPALIQDTLDCPGLLRLREVRMANIPFLRFPSFTGVTRYEHSLGVCHLAGIFAETAGLKEKDRVEIMLAALYHDVATPPFGHAVEEVLSILHGYNHEEKLREIITGETSDPGGQRTQLFLGRSLKLHKVCQSKKGRSIGLDVMRIADLAAGTREDPLGDAICSPGIDLDNVDNVIRAATAMGIREYGPDIAEALARGFTFDGRQVHIDEIALPQLDAWMRARNALYGMIYSSIDDFSLQTMLKHALRRLKDAPGDQGLREADWSLTDDELVHQRLLAEKSTAEVVTRMRLAELYTCLAFVLVEQGPGSPQRGIILEEIEHAAGEVYKAFIDRTLSPIKSEFEGPEIIANTYLDSRLRSPGRSAYFLGKITPLDQARQTPRWILGVFTPHHRNWDREAEDAFLGLLANTLTVKRLRRVRAAGGCYPNVQEA
jgi:HD superfamily phosphohydrolase